MKTNSVTLIGNVGQEIETATLQNGKQVANLSIATNENYTNAQGEKVQNTQWHNLVAYGKTAENIAKFVSKGDKIAVEGKLNYRSYDDKEGIKRYVTEIIVNSVLFLSNTSKEAQEAEQD